MEINYSIIIPHKDIPDLLQRCLDSIPQQNDVEIIIIDDNSSSSIVDFTRFPGIGRENVAIIFDKSDKGPGVARNIGIKKAKGRWVTFIDADDYFNYCIKNVMADYLNDTSDVVFFSASSADSDTYVNTSRSNDFVSLIENYFNNRAEGELGLRYVLASPCGKLIKRSFLVDNNIEFSDTSICEDVKFSYLLGWWAKEIKVDKRALYCYTSRATTRSSVKSEALLLDKIRVYAVRDRFLMDKQIPLSYGSFYVDALFNIQNQNNKELFNKAITVINECGISQEQIDLMLNSLKKARRRKEIKETLLRKTALLFRGK